MWKNDTQRCSGVCQGKEREDGGPEVHGPSGPVAAHNSAIEHVRRERFQGREGLRRLLHTRIPGDKRERHDFDS